MFALIDPNWGDPKVVPSTVRETEDEAWEAAPLCDEVSSYSGASELPLPNGTKGTPEKLLRHGYWVAPVRIEIDPLQ